MTKKSGDFTKHGGTVTVCELESEPFLVDLPMKNGVLPINNGWCFP